jgi:hypothetical protein
VDHNVFILILVVLSCTEALVQLGIMKTLDWEHLRCGCTFAYTYTLLAIWWALPETATMIDILAIAHCVTLVFNFGCLLEVAIGVALWCLDLVAGPP